MEQNQNRFPWTKFIIIIAVEVVAGLVINLSQGQYPTESIGGIVGLWLPLLTLFLFAFIYRRK